jgi:hypothetical protein
MKRNVLFGAMVVTAMTVGIGAQSGQSGSDQPSSRTQKSSDATTITGCLQAADGSGTAIGTSGSTGTAPAEALKADHFILSTAAKGATATSGAAAPSATATTGASAPRTSPADNSFILSGGDKDELRRLVNSKVEIQGKIEEGAAAGTHNNGASSNAGTTGSAMSTGSRAPETKASGRTLRIESIRQIAASCS